ncbi:molybdopterin-dependent oxidoreductase [Metapseudomonas otitidis]|uniref:molybdopterin-dependent oxidoreductase n=1 Tax=Metapseudomonas otitidis TaxID=319939 RepID=UPI000D1A97A1|nr:molybdopterin-dependent oxidoreductase [Pseudomonas otitidis]MBO2931030.1 molybdopterin-dependent oxidoreductase [Pseudomonas otitidis]
MTHRPLLPLALGLLLSPALHAAAFVPDDPSTYVTDTLQVTGEVQHALTLDVDALRTLPAHDYVDVAKACGGDVANAEYKGYRGALLRDVVQRAALAGDDPKAWKRAYLVAHASDAYIALFSWNELLNTSVGDGVLVVYAQHGQPLPPEVGHIALVSGCDRHPGPRHVKWLKAIEVKTVPL